MSETESLKQAQPQKPPAEEQALGDLLVNYWRLLRRYYWLILIVTIVAVVGAYLWTQQQTKIYKSESSIVFHQNQDNVLGRKIEQVNLMDPGGRWEFEQFWNTQKAVLESNWFAKRVVQRLGLLENRKFLSKPPDGQERSEEDKMQVAVGKLNGVSRISLIRDSRVGKITVEMAHPELSAEIANAMAEEYVEYTKEFQSGGLKKITRWFDSYVKSKRQDLEESQEKLEEFKRDNNILSFSYEDRQNITAKSMEQVNTQLLKVRSKLSAKQALLDEIRKMRKSADSLDDKKAIANLVDDKGLKELFQREADVEARLAELKARYGPKHPEVRAATEKYSVIEKNIRSKIERIRSSVDNRVSVLKRNEKNLQAQLADLKQQIFKLNELGVKYKQLKSRTENLKDLYETVLQRSAELNINSLYKPQEIQVLERASTPDSPVKPSLPLNLAIGLLLGLGAGAGLTVVVDTLDTTIKREEDIMDMTDKPILAMLPTLQPGVLDGLEMIGDSAADTVTYTAPKSSYAEGIKTLRTNLTFMSPDKPPQSLLITSAGPGEGKTLSSTNVAIAMAQSGLNTLLIDTDLRKPRVHKALGVSKSPGMTTLITDGDSRIEDVVQTTGIDNLSVLSAGDLPPNPSELLHSEKFGELKGQLDDRYDRIIFDSPPLAAVSDALILSQLVDGVLVIVEFGKTRKETLSRSLEQLHGIGAPLLGTVINEISGQAGHGYEYSYYRYSYYGEDANKDRKEKRLAG